MPSPRTRACARATTIFTATAVAGLLFAVAGGSGAPASASRADCGVWRWPVKTLSDPLASKVGYRPLERPVTRLRRLPAPSGVFSWPPFKTRTRGAERRTYRIRVRLIEAAREDDHDIHLVVASRAKRSKTMIVEFANPKCSGAVKSAHRGAMRRARKHLLADCGPIGSSFVHLRGTATITGVGFWDDVHGQNGVAPNGIELHPVLSYRGHCSRAGSGARGGSTGSGCSSAYPDFCIPPPPPDLDCADVNGTDFTVLPPDPHGFDGDGDGVGCET